MIDWLVGRFRNFIPPRNQKIITLLGGCEEGDGRELAVSLRVEAGHLHHVLAVGAEALQAGPAVPVTRGQLRGRHPDLAPVIRVYRLQWKVIVTVKCYINLNIIILKCLFVCLLHPSLEV